MWMNCTSRLGQSRRCCFATPTGAPRVWLQGIPFKFVFTGQGVRSVCWTVCVSCMPSPCVCVGMFMCVRVYMCVCVGGCVCAINHVFCAYRAGGVSTNHVTRYKRPTYQIRNPPYNTPRDKTPLSVTVWYIASIQYTETHIYHTVTLKGVLSRTSSHVTRVNEIGSTRYDTCIHFK